jgi:hypothetical protein
MRFHGCSWNGKTIKVEPIRDNPSAIRSHPKKGRILVPESLVSYVCGEAKYTKDGKVNTLRRAPEKTAQPKSPKKKSKSKSQLGSQKRSTHSQFPVHKLSEVELGDFYRASRKGFVTLSSTGYRRGRKTCPLANTHRQWCEEREKPQIVLCKASGGRPLDNVIVDLSPLRISPVAGNDPKVADDLLVKWKGQILMAAETAGMIIRQDYVEDNTVTLLPLNEKELECVIIEDTDHNGNLNVERVEILVDSASWATKPIFELPVLSMGVFEGERSRAKEMARELAILWDIPEEPANSRDSAHEKSKKKQTDKRQHQRSGRNTRDMDWYL